MGDGETRLESLTQLLEVGNLMFGMNTLGLCSQVSSGQGESREIIPHRRASSRRRTIVRIKKRIQTLIFGKTLLPLGNDKCSTALELWVQICATEVIYMSNLHDLSPPVCPVPSHPNSNQSLSISPKLVSLAKYTRVIYAEPKRLNPHQQNRQLAGML
jgi:hypothetical protein